MGGPIYQLPKPISNDAINHLPQAAGLPNASENLSSKVTAQYQSIYLIPTCIRVSQNKRSIHTRLVLRVSGQHLTKLKTDNEIAVMALVAKNTTRPVPDVVVYDSSDASPIGHEYTFSSRLEATL